MLTSQSVTKGQLLERKAQRRDNGWLLRTGECEQRLGSLDMFENERDCFWQGLATMMRATPRNESIGSQTVKTLHSNLHVS